MTSVLQRERDWPREVKTQREGHGRTEAETGGIAPQAKGHLQPEASRGRGSACALEPQGDQGPADTRSPRGLQNYESKFWLF